MKKTTKILAVAAMSICTMCTSCFVTGAATVSTPILPLIKKEVNGDLNNDGKVSIEDVTIALNETLGITSGLNEKITMEECTIILKAAIGMIQEEDMVVYVPNEFKEPGETETTGYADFCIELMDVFGFDFEQSKAVVLKDWESLLTEADKEIIEKYIDEKSVDKKDIVWENLSNEPIFTQYSIFLSINIFRIDISEEEACLEIGKQTEMYAGAGYYVYFVKENGKWVYSHMVPTGLQL